MGKKLNSKNQADENETEITQRLKHDQLTRTKQIELWISYGKLCMIYQDPIRWNQPIKLGDCKKWNLVMESMFVLCVVKCQEVEREN